MKKNLLFICSGNLDRSPTAEDVFKNSDLYEARSAGTHSDAVIRVTQELIDWADIIFTMSEGEDRHVSFLKDNFSLRGKEIHDLNISDHYDRGDPVLINLIQQRTAHFL